MDTYVFHKRICTILVLIKTAMVHMYFDVKISKCYCYLLCKYMYINERNHGHTNVANTNIKTSNQLLFHKLPYNTRLSI